MTNNLTNINRFRVTDDDACLSPDRIVIEEPLQIRLNQGDTNDIFSITMRTPGDDQELATGLLFCEGVINSASDIVSMTVETNDNVSNENQLTIELREHLNYDLSQSKRRHPSYSGCGICGKTSLSALELVASRPLKSIDTRFGTQLIKTLKKHLAKQPLFSSTGGSHVAGLIYEASASLVFDQSVFYEDVGRHNALDKLIGHELLENDLNQAGILVLSGRIGFELVQKAVIAGFSNIVALGAPSNLAIKAANQFDITLIGFAKDDCFNLYTADKHRLL
jgi:FdhD protein